MRVFAAIEIPEKVKESVLDASKYFNFKGVTLVKKEAMHITLEFFGETSQKEADRISEAMDAVRTGPFRASLVGISFFTPHRMRVIYTAVKEGAEKVTLIHDSLEKALGVQGGEKFVPHATIGRITYLKERNAFLEIASDYEDMAFGTFDVSSIVLMKSELSQDGPRYELLHESKL